VAALVQCIATKSAPARTFADAPRSEATVPLRELPPQAMLVLRAIKMGGPFAYPKDGSIFANREGRLPRKPRGYYREYTVPTPGSRDRGARRIIAGRNQEYFYTEDHYRRFRRIME
jgi:ribonuclease T1